MSADGSKTPQHIAVIGGGVIGAMCAWYLSQAGCRVTVIDRDRFGAACSHGNCGYVSPSHVLPLPQPGAIRKTLSQMLKPNSPFAVKPRLSWNSMKWFWNFSRRCNRESMLEAAVGRNQLLQSSMRLYRELVNDHAIECEWQERGLLFVYESPEELDAFAQTNELIESRFGVSATIYNESELLELEPAIKPGVAGAWHYKGDCHLRPDKLMSGIREQLEARGVEFVESLPIDRFVTESGTARSVAGKSQTIEADGFVVATGALTPFLNRHLGCNIPIEPGKGYSLTMPTPQRMPKTPIIFEESHVAITPMATKYRIGSTMEFVGYDTSINPKRLNLLKTAAKKHLVDPLCDPIEEQWFGWRPMTWDGKPFIDRSPVMDNVWIAAGHNMLGLSMATGTGKLIQEMILDQQPHIEPEHFSLARIR